MLVEFSVTNYRSFAERVTLSMEASSDKTHSGNIISEDLMGGRKDTRLLKSALVFGGNASGKSNVVCAFHALQQTVRKTGEKNAFPWIDPFRLDIELRNQPTTFEVKLALDSTLYTYSIVVDSERVRKERLVRQKWRGKEVELFHRPFDADVEDTTFGDEVSKQNRERLCEFALNERATLLGGAKGKRFKEIELVRNWFEDGLLIVDMATPPAELVKSIVERCKNRNTCRWISEAIRAADKGIEGLRVGKVAVQIASGEIQDLEIVYTQRRDRQGNQVEFSFLEESTGTQRLLSLLAPVIDALRNGSLVVFDELEASLHPRLTREMLSVMNDEEANEIGAQFVIASHDTNLLDRDLMRRDQLWLVEKNEQGATELFSWHDVGWEDRPRKEAPFEKVYLSGKLGGVPVLSALKFALSKAVFDDCDSPERLKLPAFDISTQLSRYFDSPSKYQIVSAKKERKPSEEDIRRFDRILANPNLGPEKQAATFLLKADALFELKRHDEAVEQLDQALLIKGCSDEQLAQTLVAKSIYLRDKGDNSNALECLEAASKLPELSNKDKSDIFMSQAWSLLETDRLQESINFFQSALDLYEDTRNRAWAMLGKAAALASMGRYKESLSIMDEILAIPDLPEHFPKRVNPLKAQIEKELQNQ